MEDYLSTMKALLVPWSSARHTCGKCANLLASESAVHLRRLFSFRFCGANERTKPATTQGHGAMGQFLEFVAKVTFDLVYSSYNILMPFLDNLVRIEFQYN